MDVQFCIRFGASSGLVGNSSLRLSNKSRKFEIHITWLELLVILSFFVIVRFWVYICASTIPAGDSMRNIKRDLGKEAN